MKKTMMLVGMLAISFANAQQGNLGLNTIPYNATLEIKVADINANNDTNQGILIPKLSKKRLAKIADAKLVEGTLVYIDEINTPDTPNAKVDNVLAKGFYVYENLSWEPLRKASAKLDYIVSADGSSLMQWMNKRTHTIDMNRYPDMAEVTTIENNLLQNSKVSKFIMKDGVTTIGVYAFDNSPDTEITLVPSITTIEDHAFSFNKKFTQINLPNLITMGHGAFYWNTALASVSLPKATTIGDRAFENNTALTTISLPMATTIGDYAFQYSKITSLNLPQATTIGEYAFSGNTALTSINLPQATTIGGLAFSGNTALTSINLPQATTIGHYAFSRNTALTSINLPQATTIASWAFFSCGSLQDIVIGPNVQTIQETVFVGLHPNAVVTIQATTPPSLGYSNEAPTYKVPMASVQAYRTAWAGMVDPNKIIGY